MALFLAFQAGFVFWAASGERVPPKPDFSRIPVMIGGWERLRDDPIDPAIRTQLGADGGIRSTYRERSASLLGEVFVAWFQSQRGGSRQPHSPRVCLPGAGWTFERTGIAELETEAGRVVLNQDIVAQGRQRAALLYWYQTPRRVIASEWEAKFWVAADAVRDNRTDTALVRIVVWTGDKPDEIVTDGAREFAAKLYPVLRRILPQ